MTVLARERAETLASDLLHLILLPTEACNFRCTYCYEDFRLGRMSDAVVSGVLNLISRRFSRLTRLDVAWFGGEPLVARDLVLRILNHVAELRAGRPELRFRSDMTTNGYLLDADLFRELHRLGVSRYQISFDGPPEWHDRKRQKANGNGTFARLWENLLSIRELPLDYTVNVRLHVDPENAAACGDFLEMLRRDFGGDSRFPVFLKLLAQWGGPNDETLAVYDSSSGRSALDSLEAQAVSLGVPLHEKDAGGGICYAARGNSFIIRADGRVNKCTIALEAPENQVGRLHADGRISVNASQMARWMRGLWDGAPESLGCPMKGLVADPFRKMKALDVAV